MNIKPLPAVTLRKAEDDESLELEGVRLDDVEVDWSRLTDSDDPFYFEEPFDGGDAED